MLCPVCNESMVVLELNEIEIDFCTGCSGIWLDGGELELMFDTEDQRQKLIDSLHEDPDNPEQKYRCPICNKKMIKVLWSKDGHFKRFCWFQTRMNPKLTSIPLSLNMHLKSQVAKYPFPALHLELFLYGQRSWSAGSPE